VNAVGQDMKEEYLMPILKIIQVPISN